MTQVKRNLTPREQAHQITIDNMVSCIDDERPPSEVEFRKMYSTIYNSTLTKLLEAEESKKQEGN